MTSPGILAADNRHKDPPPVRHGNGTNFSFADGHSEYWKWKDPRTISYGKLQVGSGPDLRQIIHIIRKVGRLGLFSWRDLMVAFPNGSRLVSSPLLWYKHGIA